MASVSSQQPQIRSIDGLTIRNLLSKIETPVQIITARGTPVVPPVNAEYLHERPHHQCGTLHLEDAADTYATLVTSWWDGDYTKAGSHP
jgi:hypothetical protein